MSSSFALPSLSIGGRLSKLGTRSCGRSGGRVMLSAAWVQRLKLGLTRF
jgi:hypothetical protein